MTEPTFDAAELLRPPQYQFDEANTPEYQDLLVDLSMRSDRIDQQVQALTSQGITGLDHMITRIRLMTYLDFSLGTMDGRVPVAARWPRLAYEMQVLQTVQQQFDRLEEEIAEHQRKLALATGQANHSQRPSGLIIPNGRG